MRGGDVKKGWDAIVSTGLKESLLKRYSEGAVLIGVSMSVLLYVLQQSNKITIKQWKATDGPYPIEQEPPETLPANDVITLVPYGSLFFAAAPVFEEQLPKITSESRNSAVILSMRGYDDLGSTFLTVLERYTTDLGKQNCKLILSGVSPHVLTQLEQTGLIRKLGRENVYPAKDQIGQALFEAWDSAEKWVAEQPDHPVELGRIVAPENGDKAQ